VATALLDAARGRYDSARAVGDRVRDQQRESAFFVRSATQFLRAVALVQGRLADGDRLTSELERSGADTAGTEHDAVPATVRAMMDVQYRRTPAGGVRRLQDYVRSARFERPDPLDRPYLATAQVYAMAGRADLARPMVDAFDRAVAAAADAGARQRARLAPAYADAQATIAIAEGRPDSAIALLRQPQPLRTEFWSLPLLGRAYDAAGRSDSAIAVFERYLRTPQMERVFLDQWALAPVLRRLGELYEARGDRERAREYYGRFVDLWKGADPELQPQVRDIKRRIGELTREPSES